MKSQDSIIEKLRTIFVTIEVFNLRVNPLEKIAYGVLTMIVVAVIGALLTVVIRK